MDCELESFVNSMESEGYDVISFANKYYPECETKDALLNIYFKLKKGLAINGDLSLFFNHLAEKRSKYVRVS